MVEDRFLQKANRNQAHESEPEKDNLDEAANETENMENALFQNLREENVPRRREQLTG